jgi:hypothetical protein
MSENTFDPQEINLQFQPLPAFIDPDGSFKLNTPMLSSFNFDGSIPKFDGNIDAIDIKPGYLIQTEVGGQYYPVVSIESDDSAIESTGLVTINYIDESGNTVSEEYGETDQVAVVYENWSEKILGSQGWGITAEGNAIFTNVAVRGRIEAEEGYISGTLTIGDGGTNSLDDVLTTGDAANDINTNTTTISGGKITTGSITADKIDVTNLTVRKLETFPSSLNTRIVVTDSDDNRHKIKFQTGWTYEAESPFIGAAYYKPINSSWGSNFMGTKLSSGYTTSGAVLPDSTIELRAYQYNLTGEYRQILYTTDYHKFGGTNEVGSTSVEIVGNLDVSLGTITAVDIDFTGSITGDGSGLTNLPGSAPPYVLSTSGPSSPSSYVEGTVWYVY